MPDDRADRDGGGGDTTGIDEGEPDEVEQVEAEPAETAGGPTEGEKPPDIARWQRFLTASRTRLSTWPGVAAVARIPKRPLYCRADAIGTTLGRLDNAGYAQRFAAPGIRQLIRADRQHHHGQAMAQCRHHAIQATMSDDKVAVRKQQCLRHV